MLLSDLFWVGNPGGFKSTRWGHSPEAGRQRNLARDRRQGKGVLGRESGPCETWESSKSIAPLGVLKALRGWSVSLKKGKSKK